MKIAIITPSCFPSISGNATTVGRIAKGLWKNNIQVRVFTSAKLKSGKYFKKLKEFNPDVVHAFHAYKSGIIALNLCKMLGLPLVTTITGTDLNVDLLDKGKRRRINNVLEFSKAIVVFNKTMGDKLAKNLPKTKEKIRIMGQSVSLDSKPFDIRKKLKIKNEFLFFIPAALRKLKYENFHLDIFAELNEKFRMHLLVAGPKTEKKFAHDFLEKIKKYYWFHYIPKIDHSLMKSVFKGIDVCLNTSSSEGMSNSLLESMSVGKPVLASSIDGNKSIVKDNFNGFLFKDKNDFLKKAEKLIVNEKLRRKLGGNAKNFIRKGFSFKDEINGHIKIYRRVLAINFLFNN